MKSESEIRKILRDWVIDKSRKVQPEELNDQTPILEQRIISSLQVLDLILFLERLSGRSIEVEMLKIGVFQNIDTLYHHFFKGEVRC